MHFEVGSTSQHFSSFKHLWMVSDVFVTYRLHASFQSPSGQVLAGIVQQGGCSLSQHKAPLSSFPLKAAQAAGGGALVLSPCTVSSRSFCQLWCVTLCSKSL